MSLEASIRMLNPAASLYRTVRGELDVGKILNLAAYSSFPSLAASSTSDIEQLSSYEPNHNHDGHDHDRHPHKAEDFDVLNGISSLVIPFGALSATQATKLDEWLRIALWEGRLILHSISETRSTPSETALEVLRCKGVYWTLDGKSFVIQGVRTLYEIKEESSGICIAEDSPVNLQVGKLVLIGKLGDKSKIKSSFVSYTGIAATK